MKNLSCLKNSFLNKIAISFFFIYVFLGVLINSTYAEFSNYKMIINTLRVLCFFFMALDSLFNYLKDFKPINKIITISFIVGLLNFIITSNYKLLIFSLFLLWSSYYPFKNLLKIAKNIYFIGIIFVVLSALFKIIPNYTNSRYGSTEIRYSLGFIAPTLLSAYFMYAVLMDCFISDFKLPNIKILIYLLITLIIYKITDTRLDSFITALILCFSILIKMFYRNRTYFLASLKLFLKPINRIYYILPLLAFIIGITLIVGYKHGIPGFNFIADKLSGRIQYTIKALDTHSFTLFGENINWESEDIILDSSYFKCIFEQGIIGFLFIMIFLTLSFKKAIKTRNRTLVLIFSIIALESIFEPFLFDYNYNLFPLFLTCSTFYITKVSYQSDIIKKILFIS